MQDHDLITKEDAYFVLFFGTDILNDFLPFFSTHRRSHEGHIQMLIVGTELAGKVHQGFNHHLVHKILYLFVFCPRLRNFHPSHILSVVVFQVLP